MDLDRQIQSPLKLWLELRTKSKDLLQEIVNDKSRLSILDSNENKSFDSITSLSKPSRQLNQLQSQLETKFESIIQLNDERLKSLDEITRVIHTFVNNDDSSDNNDDNNDNTKSTISSDFYKKLLEQIRQQSLLELCIVDEITSTMKVSDHDRLVTLMASFTYTPYINISDVSDLLR